MVPKADSHPYQEFRPTKGYTVTVEEFPVASYREEADMLDVPFPNSYRYFVCEGALYHNVRWEEGYYAKMSCNNKRPTDGTQIVDLDLVVGYDRK